MLIGRGLAEGSILLLLQGVVCGCIFSLFFCYFPGVYASFGMSFKESSVTKPIRTVP